MYTAYGSADHLQSPYSDIMSTMCVSAVRKHLSRQLTSSKMFSFGTNDVLFSLPCDGALVCCMQNESVSIKRAHGVAILIRF